MAKSPKRRKRRNKRRRERARRAKQAMVRVSPEGRALLRLTITPKQLEMVAGYDQLFRGHPEPTILVGVYRNYDSACDFVCRELFRFDATKPAPTWIQPPKSDKKPRVLVPAQEGHLILLIIAIEEDAGSDINASYRTLEKADEIVVWPLDQGDPAPVHLSNLPPSQGAARPRRYGLRLGDGVPIDSFRGDDYVGTSIVSVPVRKTRGNVELAVPIESRDGKNHWVPHFSLSLR